MDFDRTKLKLVRLELSYQFNVFDCDDSDLNQYLLTDSINYLRKRMSVTYLLEYSGELIAFFSVANDKISIKDFKGNPNLLQDFQDNNNLKNIASYPAVKIGRLAVDKTFQGHKIGTFLIDYIKNLFITNNRTGCGFITVDAYKQSLDFYSKLGFYFLTPSHGTSRY